MSELFNYYISFTETYKKYSNDEIEQREVECLKIQYPFIFRDIRDNDLFAGRIKHKALGFSPQMDIGFGYYFDENDFNELIKDPVFTNAQKQKLKEIAEFWKTENTASKTRAAYSKEMREILPSDNWNGESGIGFPLYRMSGSHLDHAKLLRLGIPGLRREIQQKKQKVNPGEKSYRLYAAMESALELFAGVCNRYADMAEAQRRNTKTENRRQQLHEMAGVLRHIASEKPVTFFQAAQLAYLYTVISGSVNYGRPDDYLGDFYVADLESGGLSEKKGLELLKSLWVMMNEREDGNWIFDSRVIIGGMGRKNETHADRLAQQMIETTRQVKNVMPQLTLRFYKGQNPALYQKALDTIAEGNPYPMLYNDDVNVPSVQNAFNISFEEAKQYLPFGCGEYVIYQKSAGTPSGVINLLQALLVTLHKGINPTTGNKMGLPASQLGEFNTFDDVYNSYKKQVEYYVEYLARQEELEYKIAGQTAPFLYFSILFDDCIDRGKAVFDGGIRYLGGTLETYGNSNTADSLLAIKKLVFEEKRFTLEQLVKMLDKNFINHEKERKLCLNVPKYGNDDEEADNMLVEVDRHICTVTRDQKELTGLHSYLVVIINNNANTVMGRYTCASPDGRKAYTPMNNGNAPSSGFDRSGVTAFLNSIVKPDPTIHAGTVQNMKFSKDLFNNHRDKLEILLETYFENGGTQAMLNVVGKQDLENALKFPEKYQNLIVRVGGFSAKFVDLDPDIQQEILARTLY